MRSLYSAMRSLTDSIAANSGSSARCSSGLKPSAFSGFMLRTLQPRNRSPKLLAKLRTVLTSPVRARTSPARARIIIRSACACALRCFTGYSNSGSIRASRAKVCASSRSSFLRLSPISRTLRAFATITSCPHCLSKRLIQGECVPISSAIRLRGMVPKTSCNAFAFVRTRCSNCICPTSSSTQYQLLRSPKSSPMVSLCCDIFLLCFVLTVLTFFIAGLLYLLCFEHVDNLGAYTASRRRPAFSSHLLTSTTQLSPAILREAMTESPANRKSKPRRQKDCAQVAESRLVSARVPKQLVRGDDLARVEAAIHQRNKAELQWADEYCRRRAGALWDPKRRDRSEHWLRLRARVADALLKTSRS